MKILLRTFKIDIEDIEDTLFAWKANSYHKRNRRSCALSNVRFHIELPIQNLLFERVQDCLLQIFGRA